MVATIPSQKSAVTNFPNSDSEFLENLQGKREIEGKTGCARRTHSIHVQAKHSE